MTTLDLTEVGVAENDGVGGYAVANLDSPNYTLGPVCKGSRQEIIAVPEIRVYTQAFAQLLLKQNHD